MKIFPELNGFVIYSPERLEEYLEKVKVGDLLEHLANSEDDGLLVDSGVLLPIFNVEEGLYNVVVTTRKSIADEFLGFFSSEGMLCVVGVGYLSGYSYDSLCAKGKVFKYSLDKGGYLISYQLDGELLRLVVTSDEKKQEQE
ncbi:hypothetical protein VXM60_11970 [Shewanella khirikhana]|uniref:hypothetical protein n=1 Tax=Shewanella khirikhana TaxID=1965282 RepID=UPI0030D51587